MDKPLSLTLRYSANIAGDLALLPRLHTFLQRLNAADGARALLLDLGESCAESAWHCRATGGRSALIVLDGMGYHAANVAGALDAENRDKLAAQVTMALVDSARDWAYHMPPVRDPSIIVRLRPRLFNGAARLADRAEAGRRKRASRAMYCGCAAWKPAVLAKRSSTCAGAAARVSATTHALPADTPPNPTIAGAVEFVEAEARYYLRQQQAGREKAHHRGT